MQRLFDYDITIDTLTKCETFERHFGNIKRAMAVTATRNTLYRSVVIRQCRQTNHLRAARNSNVQNAGQKIREIHPRRRSTQLPSYIHKTTTKTNRRRIEKRPAANEIDSAIASAAATVYSGGAAERRSKRLYGGVGRR